MPDFRNMTLQELTCQEGYDCECGQHHACPIPYLNISSGAITDTPNMVKTLGAKYPFVLCDENTYKAAGETVVTLLKEANIPCKLHILPGERISPAEWEAGSVLYAYDPKCDLVLGVGSGVINDLCKVLAHAVGKQSAIVGTAPSMDGYASNSAAMEVGKVKVSLYNQMPAGILLDTKVLSNAPMRMLWAGLGDIVAKYCALCEWKISHAVIDEYYCEQIADMMRGAMEKVVAAAPGIPTREESAMQAIAEGLVLAGIAMSYAKISRPASGLEHYFSHMWEMMALERGTQYDLHGIQVGVGTLLTLKIFERLKTVIPDEKTARAHMDGFCEADWEAQVRRIFGKTADEIIRIENATHKNSKERFEKRIENILSKWDVIVRAMEDELPNFSDLYETMKQTGMPLTPSDLNIPKKDVVDAFLGARDIRDKYLCCSLIWDLGLTDDFAQFVETIA